AADDDFARRVRGQSFRGSFGCWREILLFAFGRAAFFPIDDEFELLGGEALVVAEVAEAFDCAPGRHAAAEHFFTDGFGPGAGFLPGGEREGRAAFAVAGDAVGAEE